MQGKLGQIDHDLQIVTNDVTEVMKEVRDAIPLVKQDVEMLKQHQEVTGEKMKILEERQNQLENRKTEKKSNKVFRKSLNRTMEPGGTGIPWTRSEPEEIPLCCRSIRQEDDRSVQCRTCSDWYHIPCEPQCESVWGF